MSTSMLFAARRFACTGVASLTATSLLLWGAGERPPVRSSWLESWSANPAEAAHSASVADGGRHRIALVVVGPTGAGKSSTANTLCGRVPRKFAVGDTASSVTAAASHRDYFFAEHSWRVIDTPGLGDTHRPRSAVAEELRAVAALAPAGALFVIVVPHGRVNSAQETALAELMRIFGPSLPAAAIIAVTKATAPDAGRALLSREALLEDLAALPRSHALRALVDATGGRVIAVDNRLEPHRTLSRLAIHNAALALLASRDGRAFDVAAAVAASNDSPSPPPTRAAVDALDALCTFELDHAVLRVERSPDSRRARVVIEGDIPRRTAH